MYMYIMYLYDRSDPETPCLTGTFDCYQGSMGSIEKQKQEHPPPPGPRMHGRVNKFPDLSAPFYFFFFFFYFFFSLPSHFTPHPS